MGNFKIVKLLDAINLNINTDGTLNKYDATAPPGVSDDGVAGYSVGSHWIDVTGDEAYIAVDVTTGAAVWRNVSTFEEMDFLQAQFMFNF